ncbi:hypothetical protein BH10PSE17_BH10PSE17_03620 [soil metagenome]
MPSVVGQDVVLLNFAGEEHEFPQMTKGFLWLARGFMSFNESYKSVAQRTPIKTSTLKRAVESRHADIYEPSVNLIKPLCEVSG